VGSAEKIKRLNNLLFSSAKELDDNLLDSYNKYDKKAETQYIKEYREEAGDCDYCLINRE
jgi:hypothetical protein